MWATGQWPWEPGLWEVAWWLRLGLVSPLCSHPVSVLQLPGQASFPQKIGSNLCQCSRSHAGAVGLRRRREARFHTCRGREPSTTARVPLPCPRQPSQQPEVPAPADRGEPQAQRRPGTGLGPGAARRGRDRGPGFLPTGVSNHCPFWAISGFRLLPPHGVFGKNSQPLAFSRTVNPRRAESGSLERGMPLPGA